VVELNAFLNSREAVNNKPNEDYTEVIAESPNT